MDSKAFMKKKFAQKYLDLSKQFPDINEITRREFAFSTWDSSPMIRHIGFSNQQLFLQKVKGLIPKHIYASAAIYEQPDNKKMDQKGWLGCDFIVDIDADHIDLDCAHNHDYHICQKCGSYNNGSVPETCPECGDNKWIKQPWLCNECLEYTKNEVSKLIDFFTKDFGLNVDDLHIKFSGHRGYHVQIYDNKLRKLDSESRRQIADYLTGTNFQPAGQKKFNKSLHTFLGFLMNEPGWRGKIANKFYKILQMGQSNFMNNIPSSKKLDPIVINAIFEPDNNKMLLNQLKTNNINWSLQRQGMAEAGWNKLIQFLINEIKCDIDIPVTIDIHRLFRVNGSINGKTGFLVKSLNIDELKKFNPFNDPVIFDSTQSNLYKIKIIRPIVPKIEISNSSYGSYVKDEIIEVPEAVAVFLIAKEVAEIIQ